MTARKPGRPVVSPEDITRHALALLDQEGASGLSLRKIAAAMGVTPMALYRYVDGRSALVASLLDSILAPVQLPPEGGSPLATLTAFLEAYGAAVTRHAHGHAISIALARASADPAADYRSTIGFLLGRLIRG